MPSKGFRIQRENIISRKLHKRFVKETNVDIDYKTFKGIILSSNQVIYDIISGEPEGFKLPEGLGYIIVTKYPTKKKAVDRVNSKKFKRTIYFPNLHSFGELCHIKWFTTSTTMMKFHPIYKFKACRFLSRQVAKNVLEEKVEFFNWKNSDLKAASSFDRFYNKKFKTQDT